MASNEIRELQRVFGTRLDSLGHILRAGERHLPDMDVAMRERLVPDMFPLGTQVAIACDQARAFAHWCAGVVTSKLDPDVGSVAVAHGYIADSRALLAGISVEDAKLDEIRRTELGTDAYMETPGRLYVSDYLMPNFYFHVTTAYAILRKLGVPIGKVDYMGFLMPHVRRNGEGGS